MVSDEGSNERRTVIVGDDGRRDLDLEVVGEYFDYLTCLAWRAAPDTDGGNMICDWGRLARTASGRGSTRGHR